MQRAAGRRRLKVLLGVFGAAGLVAGGLAVLHSPLLAARHVRLEGAVHESRAAVLSATGLAARPPLIDLAPGRAAAALESMPWVAHASVTRDWPDGVTVVIRERRALGAVATGAHGVALVDRTGRVLADVASRPADVAPLVLPASPPRPGESLPTSDRPLLAAASALPKRILGRVAALSTRPGSGVVVQLVQGPVVELGEARALGAKMESLVTLIVRGALTGVRQVNLTVPTAPVLTP